MGLKPVWDSSDEFFNSDAATAAYELVMKMDDEEARAFTTAVVADTLWETMESNQRTLQSHLNRVISKRANAAIEALGEDAPEEIREELSKAAGRNPYYYGYSFDENDFNRDKRTGQFKTKVRYNATKPANDRSAARLGLPTKDRLPVKLGDKKMAQYQEGYAQVANFLQNFQDNGLAGDVDFIVTYKDLHTGRTYSKKHTGTNVPDIDPANERFEEVVARPSGLTGAGASFGLVSALGGSDRVAYGTGATVNRADRNFTSFSDSWLDAGETTNSNARLYGRVKSGSDFLGEVAPAGSKLQIAAGFGSFVGQHGPQAEKVIGPKARRTMYRYRGTEKTPDSELTAEYEKATRSPRNVDGSESGTLARRYATAYMANKVPNQRLYDLNLKSGHTPPSEGVIIDKNGKLARQAIGYGDDHYLPFNLKNLAALRGGEYIRTRSVGGPTTEDIYTGLVAGAQRITVVSRSGTFVVEFDDTFRGTRRYNDKAARMVDRYGKLVDAVKSEQVVRSPLEPSVKQAIRDEVERTMSWAPPAERKAAIRRKEDEYKLAPQITAEDERQIEVQVRQAAGNDERVGNQIRAQLRNQILESKAYNFRLNGDGYAAAIKALEEQFPYYIADTKYAPRRDVGTYESETDQGYVKPRHNRPAGALEGYYDASIAGMPKKAAVEGKAKFRADTADYQNWKHNPQRGGSAAADEGGDDGVATSRGTLRPTTPSGAPAAKELLADEMSRKEKAQPFADAAVKLRSTLRGTVPETVEKENPVFTMTDEQLRAEVLKGNTTDLEAAWDAVKSAVATSPSHRHVRDAGLAYETAKGKAGGSKWDPAVHMTTPPKAPLEFPEPEYLMGGDPQRKLAALEALSKTTWLPGGKELARMRDDAEFIAELKSLIKLREIGATIRAHGGNAEAIGAVRGMGMLEGVSDDDLKIVVNQPETLDASIEGVNRGWTLRDRWRESEGNNLNRLLDVPSQESGSPKVARQDPIKNVIVARPKTVAERDAEADKFHAAIESLTRHAIAAEDLGDQERATAYGDLIFDLRSSANEPFSANAQAAWKRYDDYVNGRQQT